MQLGLSITRFRPWQRNRYCTCCMNRVRRDVSSSSGNDERSALQLVQRWRHGVSRAASEELHSMQVIDCHDSADRSRTRSCHQSTPHLCTHKRRAIGTRHAFHHRSQAARASPAATFKPDQLWWSAQPCDRTCGFESSPPPTIQWVFCGGTHERSKASSLAAAVLVRRAACHSATKQLVTTAAIQLCCCWRNAGRPAQQHKVQFYLQFPWPPANTSV
jgi:hypothetical protein